MGLAAKLKRLATWPGRAYRRRSDPVGYARSLGVRVGKGCRFLGRVHFGTEPYLITIGDRVSISDGSVILTHDGGVWAIREESPDADIFAPVTIGSNVFIGARVTVLPGAVIGDNCVIGTGSVVVGEIPPDSVAAGIPAKVIRPIEEYKAKCRDKALHVRSLPRDVLRRKLIEHFGLDEDEQP
ncbi:acyltransferase [Phycisphaeraceae bacterium D3-23]